MHYLLNMTVSTLLVSSVIGCNSSSNNSTLDDNDSTTDNSVALEAPVVTASSTQPKTLNFSWSAITGADHYTLQKNPDGVSGFAQQGADIATTDVDEMISVHTHDWDNASYMVEACDTSDTCTASTSVSTTALMLNAIGYLKASDNVANLQFGGIVQVSSDGSVLATSAPGGIGNDVYVFRYDSTNGWSQDPVVTIPTGTIFSMTLSGDGNVLGVGNTSNDVYIYKYTTSWALEYTIPTPVSSVTFGLSSALSRDGLSIAIGDTNYSTNGSAYVFIDDLDGSWSQRGSVITASDAVTNPGAGFGSSNDQFGTGVSLSSDGTTLAVGAVYAETATAIDAGQVYIYRWGGASWSEQDILAAATPADNSRFGHSVSLSDNGNTLAAGRDPQGGDGDVHIFRYTTGWAQQGSALTSSNAHGLGRSVSLSADGNTLLAGAYNEDTLAAGINPVQDSSASSSGAAYLFTYSGSSWSEDAFIKAPTVTASDRFGYSVDMAADGSTLIIGSYLEDSNSTGINSTYNNDASANNSGAAYIY